MRVLLDTNILIPREDQRIIPRELNQFLRLLHETGATVLLHPGSLKDIDRDEDEARRTVLRSKLMSYAVLEAPPQYELDPVFCKIAGDTDRPNDKIDNSLLYAVYRDSVNLFITEDRKLLGKAARANLADRVLTTAQASSVLRRLLPNEEVGKPAALRDDYVYNLDAADPFFDSLKQEYSEFPEWTKKIAADARKCWVYVRPEGGIGALLIRKIEEEAVELTECSLPKSRRLKLCTFKVGSTGLRIGELFVKLAVEYAVKNSLSEIYLTHFLTAENDELVDLVCEYGFRAVGLNRRGRRSS